MNNISDMQLKAIEYCKEVNCIIKKVLVMQEEDVNKFAMDNVEILISFGKASLSIMQIFGLEEYYHDAKIIVYLCSVVEKDRNFSNIDIAIKDILGAIICMCDEIEKISKEKIQRCCPICENKVFYMALSSYYTKKREKYDAIPHILETLNEKEYLCPNCFASDRDRLIVSFLKKIKLDELNINESLLQIAPSHSIENWINENTISLTYHSTDLYMDDVTFKSDIQNMYEVENETYDYIICSHVLEHVKDDIKALKELKRILKSDGFLIFLVPISLDMENIDEEWGCSEEENWRRFGQGDHCRIYGKKEFLKRVKDAGFYVHQLDKKYFGEECFKDCALTDTSVLYVLTKSSDDIDRLIQKRVLRENYH